MKAHVNYFEEKVEKKKELLAAIYVRVSILTQIRNGAGLDVQEEQCRNYCQYRNIKVYDVYSDEAVTGYSEYDERRGLSKLMADAKKGLFNTVVIFSLDRMGRNLLMIGNTIKELQDDLSLNVFSCAEDLDLSTEEGKLSMYMFAWVSHLELTNIRIRMHEGLKKRRSIDGFIGGALTYGYCRQDNSIYVDEDKAMIVKYIFYVCHKLKYSMNKIAKILTHQQIPTPKGKSVWHRSTVKYILDNKGKYEGTEVINGNLNDVYWPKILDQKLD
jgi:site-specific DNA recombinase